MNPLLIAVCTKAVWRTDMAVRLAGGSGVLSDGAEPVLNAADGAALAAALRLRAPLGSGARPGGEGAKPASGTPRVLALAVGPRAWEPVLRAALAAGADEVLRVWPAGFPEGTEAGGARTLDGSAGRTRQHAALAAEALRARLAAGPLLVLAGESSADEGHECFGAFVAQALGLEIAHRVMRLEDARTGWTARVKLERGYAQELALQRSAVATVAGPGEPLQEPSWPAWLASRTAPIPLLNLAPPAQDAPAPRTVTALRPPLPRVKRYRVPSSSTSAEERIRSLLGGPAQGGSAPSSGAVLPAGEGVERQADAIAGLLKERGYLKG